MPAGGGETSPKNSERTVQGRTEWMPDSEAEMFHVRGVLGWGGVWFGLLVKRRGLKSGVES